MFRLSEQFEKICHEAVQWLHHRGPFTKQPLKSVRQTWNKRARDPVKSSFTDEPWCDHNMCSILWVVSAHWHCYNITCKCWRDGRTQSSSVWSWFEKFTSINVGNISTFFLVLGYWTSPRPRKWLRVNVVKVPVVKSVVGSTPPNARFHGHKQTTKSSFDNNSGADIWQKA